MAIEQRERRTPTVVDVRGDKKNVEKKSTRTRSSRPKFYFLLGLEIRRGKAHGKIGKAKGKRKAPQ
jgi:hypothetical protein